MSTEEVLYTKCDEKYEMLLEIDSLHDESKNYTTGFYAPYVPSSYYFLEKFLNDYFIKKTDIFVDFGCGKGRVPILLNYLSSCKSIGVEYDKNLYKFAMNNKKNYEKKYGIKNVDFIHEKAENVLIPENASIFYFYNPFSIIIFARVIRNILKSNKNNEFTIILFRPIIEYCKFLETSNGFELFNILEYESADKVRNDIVFYVYKYKKQI